MMLLCQRSERRSRSTTRCFAPSRFGRRAAAKVTVRSSRRLFGASSDSTCSNASGKTTICPTTRRRRSPSRLSTKRDGHVAECAPSSTRTSSSRLFSPGAARRRRSSRAGWLAIWSSSYPSCCSPSSGARSRSRGSALRSQRLMRPGFSRFSGTPRSSLQIPRLRLSARPTPATTTSWRWRKANAQCSSPGISTCSDSGSASRFEPRGPSSRRSRRKSESSASGCSQGRRASSRSRRVGELGGGQFTEPSFCSAVAGDRE